MNSKLGRKISGFTIVELLVVIVVIGILAAITVVSYTGVSQKANTAAAESNGTSAKKVIEVMASENNGAYPVTAASINAFAGSARMPGGVTVIPGASGAGVSVTPSPLSNSNGTTQVTYACLATATTGPCLTTGGRITYWNFGTQLQVILYVGAGSSAGTYFGPAT